MASGKHAFGVFRNTQLGRFQEKRMFVISRKSRNRVFEKHVASKNNTHALCDVQREHKKRGGKKTTQLEQFRNTNRVLAISRKPFFWNKRCFHPPEGASDVENVIWAGFLNPPPETHPKYTSKWTTEKKRHSVAFRANVWTRGVEKPPFHGSVLPIMSNHGRFACSIHAQKRYMHTALV